MSETEGVALTARLNKASRKIHSVSDSLVNMKLIALFSDRILYAKAISLFWQVFSALETALDEALKRGDPDVTKFKEIYTGGIYRAAGFREDLQYFLGENWEARSPPKSKPLLDYERHLAHLAATQPRLLLVHSYTQHLAVAAGGQIIRRLARQHLGLPEDRGTAAFDFKGTSSNTLKSRFKSLVDEWGAGLSEPEVQQLLAEHVSVFKRNNAVIRAFPIPPVATLRGLLRIAPRPLLLAALAAVVLLLALTVPWVAAGFRHTA